MPAISHENFGTFKGLFYVGAEYIVIGNYIADVLATNHNLQHVRLKVIGVPTASVTLGILHWFLKKRELNTIDSRANDDLYSSCK